MNLEHCIAMLQDPSVSNHDAAMAVCALPNCNDTFRHIVALVFGAERLDGSLAQEGRAALSHHREAQGGGNG